MLKVEPSSCIVISVPVTFALINYCSAIDCSHPLYEQSNTTVQKDTDARSGEPKTALQISRLMELTQVASRHGLRGQGLDLNNNFHEKLNEALPGRGGNRSTREVALSSAACSVPLSQRMRKASLVAR